MMRHTALVVDDEPDICELLTITLERMNIKVTSALTLKDALHNLGETTFNLCLTDMRLPDGDGLELVAHVQKNLPELPVAVITAHGNMDTAISALKSGAFDFVSKPVDIRNLRKLVKSALELNAVQPDHAPRDTTFLGSSPAIRNINQMIGKLSRSQAPVYISGETGTGKEVVAREIHSQSPRHHRPFIAVNCGALPEHLAESEFFGHRKGSFTGAISDKTGLFQAADGGTLFLDEVADLPLPLQVKLLRAIQEKRIRCIGDTDETPVDVRILSASHKDLKGLVEQESFRQDLFYRIHVIHLHIPPLRERREDIPKLVHHLLGRLSIEHGIATPTFDRKALEGLLSHPFPGNVRELENLLERALALCDEGRIKIQDLALPDIIPTPNESNGISLDSLETYLDAKEKEAIVHALESTRYNKTATAKLLGISFGALRYRLKKHDLE